MTKDEAFQVLAVIQAAWPRPPFTVEDSMVWAHFIEPYNLETMKEAVSQLILSEDFRPSIALLVGTYRSVARSRALKAPHPAPAEALTAPSVGAESPSELVARLKAQLAVRSQAVLADRRSREELAPGDLGGGNDKGEDSLAVEVAGVGDDLGNQHDDEQPGKAD